MSEERKKPAAAFWTTIVVSSILLYVLSSGPMQTLAFRKVTLHFKAPPGSGPVKVTSFDHGVWWPTIYAPLTWAVDQEWGKPLAWYWSLFPISQTIDLR